MVGRSTRGHCQLRQRMRVSTFSRLSMRTDTLFTLLGSHGGAFVDDCMNTPANTWLVNTTFSRLKRRDLADAKRSGMGGVGRTQSEESLR